MPIDIVKITLYIFVCMVAIDITEAHPPAELNTSTEKVSNLSIL